MAIFIALYMSAALGWWTYALLQYNEADAKLQQLVLEQKKLLCIQNFKTKYIKNNSENTSDFFNLTINIKEIDNYIKNINKHANNYAMISSVKQTPLHQDSMVLDIQFSIPKAVTAQILSKKVKKRNAWLGEGITVGLITLIVIVLMYYFLERILRFNQQKANFMMAVTHELKTPIAAAKLAIQTVIRNKNQENQDRVLEISKNSMDRLSSLMDRVLMATQFENSIPKKNEKWVRLHSVISQAIDEGQFTIGERLKNSLVESNDFLILCDEQMIKIVFINLFTNSIKYSEENSVNVSVKSFVRDGLFGVMVSDHGIGIPVTERNHIFEKFYRIGDERTRSRQGSGLGLYLVKQILNLHKATIEVTANTPQGSKFNIVFNANDCRME
jgi:signal transduction histidine kinase